VGAADVLIRGLMPVGLVVAVGPAVTIALIERLSNTSRMARGHRFGKISQTKTRSRSTLRSEVGVACIRLKKREEVAMRWMSFIGTN
jgi:hypothetical protein